MHAECIAAMDEALAATIPVLKEGELQTIQRILSENQSAIAREIGRRKDSATERPSESYQLSH